MKATKLEAVASSKQGTNLVVSGNLFYSNAPSNTYYKVSLSAFNETTSSKDNPKASCPKIAPSVPTFLNYPECQSASIVFNDF